jgi:hypothetical protein
MRSPFAESTRASARAHLRRALVHLDRAMLVQASARPEEIGGAAFFAKRALAELECADRLDADWDKDLTGADGDDAAEEEGGGR